MQGVPNFGTKHLVRGKPINFNSVLFLIKKFLELKLDGFYGEKLCEVEAAAKLYAYNLKQTHFDKEAEE